MNKVRVLSTVAALTAALGAGGAAAESEKPEPAPSRQLTGVFQPDPEGVWRTITPTDSTSDCIGDPVTAMCAVDTRLACYHWKKVELCHAAEADFPKDHKFHSGPRSSDLNYRVTGVRLATEADLAPRPRGIPNHLVGDLMIDVILQQCWGADCSTHEKPVTYSVRKKNAAWTIVDIYLPWY